jgi:hypothetical protein
MYRLRSAGSVGICASAAPPAFGCRLGWVHGTLRPRVIFVLVSIYSTRNQEHVFAPPFPAPQSAPPCKLPPAPIYVSSREDFRTTARVIPERSGRWAWGFPRGKKGNRVNTISVRLALANNSDDPYRSYFIILHISLRELFLRGVQQPHETGGLEMKNVLTFTRGNPNGIFSDLKNGVLLSSLLEGHSCSPWCADHAAADAKRSNN